MTKIAMRFVTTTDIPIGDALVAIRLTRSDYDEKTSGVIMPRLEEFHTDADGFLQVDLLPAKGLYHITVYDTVQDIALHHDFLVPEVEDPNMVVMLPDLIVPPDTVLSSFPYDEEALAQIIQAKAEAVAAALRAKAAADLAQGAIDSTAASAAIAEAAKVVIQAAEIAVDADAAQVRANTVLVTNYTASALQHKTDAAASASSANAAKQVALDQSAIATQAAAAAKISETNSGASNTAAQAASTASIAARDQAVTARNTTVAAKDETIAAKNTTVQKAAELASQLAAFNEIYIGKFAVHPTVDGNGNALKVGAIYENTTEGKLYQFETDRQWHPYDEESQQQMNNATLSANSAAASAGSATASKDAAEASKIAAQTAKTAAETAKTAAAASATTATTAKDTAVAASTTAVAARDTATQKAVDAAASAAAAAASAATAAAAQIQSDWIQADNTKKDFIKNKPVLAAVATTGAKADVGLGNVDNTSDANKPVSTAQQAALDLKAPKASPVFTGTPATPTPANFGNDFQVVNSAWVNQRGIAYKPVNGISLASGTQPFIESYIGAWLQFSYAGCTLSVGIADAKYTGSSFTVRASNAGVVTFPGNGVGLPNNTAPVASYSMVKGQVTTFTSLGATGWFVTADSLMPAEITKAYLGLGNVDNTSDAAKPVSTATQTALNGKLNTPSFGLLQLGTGPSMDSTIPVSIGWGTVGTESGPLLSTGNAGNPAGAASFSQGFVITTGRTVEYTAKQQLRAAATIANDKNATAIPLTIGAYSAQPAVVYFRDGVAQSYMTIDSAWAWSISADAVQWHNRILKNGVFQNMVEITTPKLTVGTSATVPTAVLQANDTNIANTAWVNRRGLAYQQTGGVGVNSGTTALRAQDLGHWLQFSQIGCVLSVDASFSVASYNGASFTVRGTYAGVVTFATGVAWPDSSGTAGSYTVEKGETVTFTCNGVAGWWVTSSGLTPRINALTYAPINNPTFTGTVSGVSKAMVGLGNADNTSDVNKPVSTAQQTALNAKAALNGDLSQNFNVASLNGSYIGGMMNRVINGDMRIDQRNNGSAVTTGFVVDRFMLLFNIAGKISAGRNLNGQSSPSGFTHNLGVSVTAAYVPTTPDTFGIRQGIEGNNVADLAWGTAGAKAVTLSFNVLSSVTGTHSGAVANGAATRSYPYTFSIPVANVWTPVSVNIPGDTAGTWTTDAGLGIELRWNLGSGTSYSAAAGAWSNSNAVGATGAVSVVSTLGAKFHITGVQFETGSKSPFSFRSYAEEIALCRRYCAVDSYSSNMVVATGQAYTTGQAYGVIPLNSVMRATPTATITGTLARLGGEVVSSPTNVGASPSGISFSVVWSATPFVAGNGLILAASTDVIVTRSAEI